MTDLVHEGHGLPLAGAAKGKKAVSCLAARGTKKGAVHFFTGGYDKTLRLWSVRQSDLATSSEKLISLTTIPEALAYRERKLIVGSSRRISTVDLVHLSSTPISSLLSNAILQIHVHRQAPNLAVLEASSCCHCCLLLLRLILLTRLTA